MNFVQIKNISPAIAMNDKTAFVMLIQDIFYFLHPEEWSATSTYI